MSSQPVAVEVHDVVAPDEMRTFIEPGSGHHRGHHHVLAEFARGTVTAAVERFDYLHENGTTVETELGLRADWKDEGVGLADLQLFEPNFDTLDDICAVLQAAREYIEAIR